jgi:hypothetical protein
MFDERERTRSAGEQSDAIETIGHGREAPESLQLAGPVTALTGAQLEHGSTVLISSPKRPICRSTASSAKPLFCCAACPCSTTA